MSHCTRVKARGLNYRGISFLSGIGKINAAILADRVRRVAGGLIDDEQEAFRAGRGCVDKIFTLMQIVEKAKTHSVCWFYRFSEGLRQG